MTATEVKTYPKPVPRPYQIEAKDNFLAGTGNMLIQLPTGTGKSLLAAMIAAEYPGERVLFLVHTDALAYQTCETFLRYGLWPNVEKADEYKGTEYLPDLKDRKRLFPGGYPPNEWFVFNRVWVSTIQTFKDRVDKYREGGFDLVIPDEAHRSLGRSWLDTIARLKAYNPAMRVCGLSATPLRGDKQSMAVLFPGRETPDGIEPQFAYRMPITDGIDGGWLVDIECERATLAGVDESMWKVGGGRNGRDLTDESVSASMNNDACIESIAHEVLERAGGRKGIVFLPGVDVTQSVCAAMNSLRPGCAVFTHGKVPKREQRKRRRMIRDGDAQFILGCDQLIEGFDVPDISLVVMARFTAQRGRYEQMLGRGLRVFPASCIEGLHTAAERRAAIAASVKPTCKVIDFSNNSRFKLMRVEDILLTPDGGDAGERGEFVRKHRDPEDKRRMREQLEELDAIYLFEQALQKAGGPPKKEQYRYETVNVYGGGAVRGELKQMKTDGGRPSADQVAQALDLMIQPERAERMTAGELRHAIEQAKLRKCGRKNFGFLVGGCGVPKESINELGVNWHDAQYLRRLARARPGNDLPHNWPELMANDRERRKKEGKP